MPFALDLYGGGELRSCTHLGGFAWDLSSDMIQQVALICEDEPAVVLRTRLWYRKGSNARWRGKVDVVAIRSSPRR